MRSSKPRNISDAGGLTKVKLEAVITPMNSRSFKDRATGMKFNSRRWLSLSLLVVGSIALIVVCEKTNQAASVTDPSSDQVAQTNTASATDPQASQTNSKAAAGNETSAATEEGMAAKKKMKFPAPADIKFKDKIKSNVRPPKSPSELVFTSKDGSTIKMADYKGKQHVLLVFTEGFNGVLCPFCKTQTSRLIANYSEFKSRNCEIIVVYPGPQDHLDEFVEAALKTEKEDVDQVPFPIVLDKEFVATNYFDIHSMHAHPSTYLIDKQGGVQFAYVGADMTADRPSVKALIEKLDGIEKN